MTAPTCSRESGHESTDQEPLDYRGRYDHSIGGFHCNHCGEWRPDQRTADDCCDLVDRLFDPGEVKERDTEDADTEESDPEPDRCRLLPATFLSIQLTGLGYKYVRDRADDQDDRVYLHQVIALAAGADPHTVFSPRVDVHHHDHIPWDNRSGNLELEGASPHRRARLDSSDPEVDA